MLPTFTHRNSPAARAARSSRARRAGRDGCADSAGPRHTESLESRLLMSTYHVSPGGSDSNPGTVSAPWATLSKAASSVAAGDELVLHAGNYAGGVTFNQPRLIIHGADGEALPLISAPTGSSSTENALRVGVNGSGTTLRRLEVTGGYYYAVKLESEWGYGPAAANVTIEDCKLHDSGRDVVKITPGCNDAVVRRNEIYNSGIRDGSNAEGIDNVNADRMLVQDNYIHDIATNGLYAKGGASNCIIERNRIENTGSAGVTLGFYTDAEFFDADNTSYYESIDSVVRNNIIVNTSYAGVGLYGALRAGVYNNTLVNVGTSAQAGVVFAPSEVPTSTTTVVTPCKDVSIFNNIVQTSGRSSVQIRSGSLEGTLSINNNRYFNTSGAGSFRDERSGFTGGLSAWRTAIGGDGASTEGNPGLDASEHLTSTSPAINAGRDLSGTAGFANDFDNQTRPAGAWDVGADEYNGSVTPPPPDTTAPTISGVGTSGVTSGGATVSWVTNEASDSRVEYGTTTAYGSATATDTNRTTNHSMIVSGLQPSTVYHFRVLSRDAAGNLATSGDFTFTTAAVQPPPTSTTVFSPVQVTGDFANYAPLTASRWTVAPEGGDNRLVLNTTDYAGPVDDVLGELAVVKGKSFGDFDLTLRAKSNEDLAANPSADYAVVFGYVDANNYSYLMMNGRSTNTRLFRVVNGVPTGYAAAAVAGVPDTNWHTARVTRSGSTVTVSLDGTQILSTTDAGLARAGAVGVGSLNDSAYFDDVTVTAPTAPPPPAPVVQLASSAYAAAENAGGVTLTVTRSGDTSGASTVAYATANGTAASGSDYAAAAGTLAFAAGETSKTLTIQLLNDTVVEADETLTLTLSSPTGATLGSTSRATVTISNDDQAPPPPTTASISGFLFNDANGSVGREAGESGLAGWRVFLDADRDGVYDAGEASTTTDAAGNYRFDNLTAGSYRVAQELQAGWKVVSRAAPYYDVTAAAGASLAGYNFADAQPVTISGQVFFDRDADGMLGKREKGLSGWTVYIDADNDGTLDAGEASTKSNGMGNYTFANLDPGTYTVRAVPQAGYAVSYPAGALYTFTLRGGQSARAMFGMNRVG